MPWFRFIGEEGARVTLPFRNGEVRCSFANLGGADGWAWVAERPDKPGQQVVLVRRPNVLALSRAIVGAGFPVESGSAAERVMRAAVKCGCAEELPEDERWRQELLQARAAQRRDDPRASG